MDVHLYNSACARLEVKRGRRETLNLGRQGEGIKPLIPPFYPLAVLNKIVDSFIYFKSTLSGA
jgi:hypothetical protein